MSSVDLSIVLRATMQDPIAAIFFNRSIDWEDPSFNETRSIVDLSIVTISFFLNFIVFAVILMNQRMHNSVGCYVMSLTISNFVILLNVLDDVLNHWLAIEFKPDLDFVGRVSLQSSSLTLVMFNLDRYIAFCRSESKWQRYIEKVGTAVKGILIIWCSAAITSAMELNLYEHFRTVTIINIFCWSTVMYVLLPTLVIVGLDCLIVVELLQYRKIIKIKWSPKDLESLRLLASLTLGFYVTMVPQRVVTILYYKEPQICCAPLTMNICYYLAKVSTIVNPIIYLGTLKNLRRSIVNDQLIWPLTVTLIVCALSMVPGSSALSSMTLTPRILNKASKTFYGLTSSMFVYESRWSVLSTPRDRFICLVGEEI